MKQDVKYDSVVVKYLKLATSIVISIFTLTIAYSINDNQTFGLFVLLFVIFFPTVCSYFWINDSKKGKIFYSVIVLILALFTLLSIVFIAIAGFSIG